MKGLAFTARDKLMLVLALTLILFISILAMAFVDSLLGITLVLFDFLLAVIIILSGTTDADTPVQPGNVVHQGLYPAAQSPDFGEATATQVNLDPK